MLLFPLGALSFPFGLHVAAVAAPGPASPAQLRAVTQHPALGHGRPGTGTAAGHGHGPHRSRSAELPQHGRRGPTPGTSTIGIAGPAQRRRSRTGRRVQNCRCSPRIAWFHSGSANNASSLLQLIVLYLRSKHALLTETGFHVSFHANVA